MDVAFDFLQIYPNLISKYRQQAIEKTLKASMWTEDIVTRNNEND